MGHNYMIEETAFGNLGGGFHQKANRLLHSDSATTEGYLVGERVYKRTGEWRLSWCVSKFERS